MAIKRKLDTGDIAVLELIEDEVWLPEFLRTTSDGVSDKNLWPPIEWKHRDYQRQILTDKNKFISLTGGRAIGKCELGNARILTVDGYQYLRDLVKLPSFVVYSLTADNKLARRRARALPDSRKNVYKILTQSGNEINVTNNHPVLTEDGWKPAEEITVGDNVAVITHLPYDTYNSVLRWHELRWLGYVLISRRAIRLGVKFKPRFKKIGEEIEVIANRFSSIWHKDSSGAYSLHRVKGPLYSPLRALYIEADMTDFTEYSKNPDFIPTMVMRENNENVKTFLEALFAQYAELNARAISLKTPTQKMAFQVEELLLRFGIESRVTDTTVSLLDYEDVYNFWQTFKLPGVGLTQLAAPQPRARLNEFMRLDEVVSIEKTDQLHRTYSIYVYEDNNYVSSNVFVHNTVLLEDKIIYEVVNYDKEFPMTPEQVLATANQAQLTPLLNKLIQRFTGSRFLSSFLFGSGASKGGINKADGTMVFPVRAKPFTFFFRIAGSKGEQNMVGLHIPRIKIDEAQIFPPTAFTQLLPAFNHWEPKTQLFVAGVPNGLRSSVLFITDQKDPKYKRYRIPSHNNPFYTRDQDLINLRENGGEQDDRYQQLVLGRHGAAAFQVISRDDMDIVSYPFSNYRYNGAQKLKGIGYKDILQLPRLPENIKHIIISIDPAYTDPTVIQVLGMNDKGEWRTYIRYTLTRIDFVEQTIIIDWIASFYSAHTLSIDVGAGGNGASIMHSLIHDDKYKPKGYEHRVLGVNFTEKVVSGFTQENEEMTLESKNHGVNVLVRLIQDGELKFSDVDYEGISEVERIAKQKTLTGKDRYFILSERGVGADKSDHIFASYICFALALDNGIAAIAPKQLAKAQGGYSK